jgi:hypothetical protein
VHSNMAQSDISFRALLPEANDYDFRMCLWWTIDSMNIDLATFCVLFYISMLYQLRRLLGITEQSLKHHIMTCGARKTGFNSQKGKKYYLISNVQSGSAIHSASHPMGTRGSSSRGKAAGT